VALLKGLVCLIEEECEIILSSGRIALLVSWFAGKHGPPGQSDIMRKLLRTVHEHQFDSDERAVYARIPVVEMGDSWDMLVFYLHRKWSTGIYIVMGIGIGANYDSSQDSILYSLVRLPVWL
jgi:hypothetical protein